jgi:hypothetical protein
LWTFSGLVGRARQAGKCGTLFAFLLGMSKPRFFGVLFLFLTFLGGCGSRDESNTEKRQLTLHIELPKGLSQTKVRYEHFLSRVDFLEVFLRSKGGADLHRKIPKAEWKNILLSPVNFPKEPQDELRIKASVWDIKREGQPRGFAVLSGTKEISGQEMEKGGVREVTLKLSLQISPEEYDP